MKRLFIFISTILLSLYMVMNLMDKQEEILFGDYPTVERLVFPMLFMEKGNFQRV